MRTLPRSVVLIGSLVVAAAPLWSARADIAAPPSPGSSQFPAPPERQKPMAPAQEQSKSEAGGIVQLVDRALQGIELRPEQTEALQKLGAKVDEKMGPVSEARKNLALALADEIEAGKVDKDTLKPEIEDLVKAAESASPLLRKAFDKLHDILDSQQRQEFIEHFRDELKQARAKMDPKAQVERWSQVLKLTDEEKEKVGDVLERDKAEGKEMHEDLKKVLDAFPADSFSIDQVLPAGHVREHTEKMASRIIEDAREVTDVLTPEQRKAAADAIRSKVSGKSGGGTMGGEGPTGTTGSSLESTGSGSEALWAGGFARGGFGGFGVPGVGWGGGYGFSRGYATGFGGMYMF
jgi:hypothetical protein